MLMLCLYGNEMWHFMEDWISDGWEMRGFWVMGGWVEMEGRERGGKFISLDNFMDFIDIYVKLISKIIIHPPPTL